MSPVVFGRIRMRAVGGPPPFEHEGPFAPGPTFVKTIVSLPFGRGDELPFLPALDAFPLFPPAWPLVQDSDGDGFAFGQPLTPAPPPQSRARPRGPMRPMQGPHGTRRDAGVPPSRQAPRPAAPAEAELAPRVEPAAPEAASPEAVANDAGATGSHGGAGRVQSIPRMFQPPWEFDFTREDALFAMETAGERGGALGKLARRVRELGGERERRRELERWRERLRGRSPDEQLFGVRPPARAYAEPAVRAWAQRTLAAAGYDVAPMLREWEIFWRRKGV